MSEGSQEQAKTLLPHYVGGEIKSKEKNRVNRQEEVDNVRPLENIISQELLENGKEVPETLNLSLLAIEDFQRYVREAQDLRKAVRHAKDHSEKLQALAFYKEKKARIDEYLSQGLSFEKAYREYIRARNDFVRFKLTYKTLNKLEGALREPAFASLDEAANLSEAAYARLEAMSRESEALKIGEEEIAPILEALETIYPKGSPEYEEQARLISGQTERKTTLPTDLSQLA